MSSHHIVKDKQEPALIIANGEACSIDLLNQLLEWSPFVMVLDGAIERVMALGIKIDVLFGDFDGLKTSVEDIKKVQFPIEIIYAPDQNKTDLEKAIEYLIEKEHKAVNIVWATGRRADHTIANVTNIVKYKFDIKIKMIDNHSVIYPLCPLPAVFSKWYAADATISLLPIGTATNILTTNLKYPLQNQNLVLGEKIGNSNEAEKEGIVEISYQSGDLLIMECID